MLRQYELHGDNLRFFNDTRSRECINFGAAGTGKTLAAYLKLHKFALQYPGSRILNIRATRASLTESGMVTFERDILGPGHYMTRGPSRAFRRAYTYKNGSTIVLGGMDDPEKILSTEWDLIYSMEATELRLTEWEQLIGRLRAGAGPFDQIFGDCNPTNPQHWLYKRIKQGKCKGYHSFHHDNARYYDHVRRKWTHAGFRYFRNLLSLTGHRYKRFVLGQWAAAEGMVYDRFDQAVHVLPPGFVIPQHWDRAWFIDWGFAAPCSFLSLAFDPDGRAYLARELYRTGMTAGELGAWAKQQIEEGNEPQPVAVIGDHDPDCAESFRKASDLTVQLADKGDRIGGIDDVADRLVVQLDGRPRLYFSANSLTHAADSSLIESGKPTCTLDELALYEWKKSGTDHVKDEPQPHNDHAMDALRYGIRWAKSRYGIPSKDTASDYVPDDADLPSYFNSRG